MRTGSPIFPAFLLGLAAALVPAGAAADNMEKLGQFKTTGTSMDMEMIAQEGSYADGLRANLERIKMPAGFKIALYAVVPDARHMAIGPSTGMVFVGTRKTKVWAVTDRNKDRVADEVKVFAPSVEFVLPNGVCFTKDGFLYVVEQNRVLLFPAAEFFYERPDVVAVPVVEQGKLIPRGRRVLQSHRACLRYRAGQQALYLARASPSTCRAPEKVDLYNEWGIGGIIRMDRDGKNREVFARGIRNSVGQDFNPANWRTLVRPTTRSTAWATTSRRAS